MRALAVFWVLALTSASVGWLQALAVQQAAVDDAQVALAALGQKRVIDRDVLHVLRTALADAKGADADAKIADAVVRLAAAERFLESQYAENGVALDLFFGFLSDAEQDAWLEALAQSGRLEKCGRCLDLGPGFGAVSVLSVLNASGGVIVSRNGLHGPSLPFVPFGRPVLGAVYRFGDVLGVVVV